MILKIGLHGSGKVVAGRNHGYVSNSRGRGTHIDNASKDGDQTAAPTLAKKMTAAATSTANVIYL